MPQISVHLFSTVHQQINFLAKFQSLSLLRAIDLVALLSMLVCWFVDVPCCQRLVCQLGWYVSLSLDPQTAATIASGGLLIWFLSLPLVIGNSIYLSLSHNGDQRWFVVQKPRALWPEMGKRTKEIEEKK